MFVLIVSKGCSNGRLRQAVREPINADLSNREILVYQLEIIKHKYYICFLNVTNYQYISIVYITIKINMHQKLHISVTNESKQLSCWDCYPDQRNQRCKSIHALTPCSIKAINEKSRTLTQRTDNSIHRLRGVSYDKKIKGKFPLNDDYVVQSLFQTEKDVLAKLEKEGQNLEKEKDKLKHHNSVQYQKVVQKLIQSRRVCNKRKIQIQSLKNELNLIVPGKSFSNLRAFKERGISEKQQNDLLKNIKFSNLKKHDFQ